MLYVNLMESNPRMKPVPAFMASCAFLFAVGICAFFPRHHAAPGGPPHALGVEEREAVIVVFAHLRDRVPELSGWTEQAKEVFEEQALAAAVDPKATALVRVENDSLVFSPRFFEADSNAQESALLEGVVALNQPEKALARH